MKRRVVLAQFGWAYDATVYYPLASAMLATAQNTSEGRLAATLSLLARLVAKSDANQLLGPAGAGIRQEILPNGWRYSLSSWPRLRYAWREGLKDLLVLTPEDAPIVDALDEVTRLSPAEPEPVSVAIQESWPQPRIAFAVTLTGVLIAGYSMYRELSFERRVRGERRSRG